MDEPRDRYLGCRTTATVSELLRKEAKRTHLSVSTLIHLAMLEKYAQRREQSDQGAA